MNDYRDIINLPYQKSKKHPPMPMRDRAAQFAPFAALSGYEEAIAETARRTDSRPEPDDDTLALLNERLRLIMDTISEKPAVMIDYFVPDPRKEGGAVLSRSGQVRRIDAVNREMIFLDGSVIAIEDILGIEIITNTNKSN